MINHGDVLVHGSFFVSKHSPVARLHYTTPRIDRLADVLPDLRFSDGKSRGAEFVGDRNWVRPPAPVIEHVGQWREQDIRASLAGFYQLHYGNYLIAMNTTEEGTYRESAFELQEPDDLDLDQPMTEALDLVSGKMIDLTKPVIVEPRSTVILYLGD